MIPEAEVIEVYNQILQLGGLGVGVLAVTVVLLMVGLGFVIVRMQTRAQTADSETTQQIVVTFGTLISKLNGTMEALRQDMDARNEMQREQLDVLRNQAETQRQQLAKFSEYGKDQNNWHKAIDVQMESVGGQMENVSSQLVHFSVKIERMEATINALATFVKEAPESTDKDEIIISMLQTIGDRLEKLSSKFDTQEVEAVADETAHDEAA